MEIEFDLNTSVDENAGIYFDLAKKAKRKLEGAKDALVDSRKKLVDLEKQDQKFWEKEKEKSQLKDRKREWYEKFHWFISSEGFLCIGGKDATSNEIVVKKHTDKEDIVFHTDMAGSPFFVVKDGQKATEKTLNETAQAVGVYSRAWKLGHQTADVFYVKPEQVTKEAQSGEHLSKGSFMVMGKTLYLHPRLEYAIGLVEIKDSEGIVEKQIIGGPITAVESRTKNFVIVIPGKEKKSSLAKKIRGKLTTGDLDDIIKFLPAGGGD
ncbi:MAG: NFACT RNA binding domain-containing protein, partial [Candidatus Woesearchaeota archaeon]